MDKRESIDFVVGAEKRLRDIVSAAEVLPLLQGAVQFGIGFAELVDEHGVTLWSHGQPTRSGIWTELTAAGRGNAASVFLEGEPVGELRMTGEALDPALLQAATGIIAAALNALLVGNLKRMLTTEIHTQVVNQSYAELLAANRQLVASEQKYRELAENLELRVKQRTDELKRLYTRMVNQDKMAAIGQMAAGIAHEINNPLGFIRSNLSSLQGYLARYQEMLAFYREGLADPLRRAELPAAGEERYRALKLDFVAEDLLDLFAESISGAERVQKIVADLKGFSHIDALQNEQLDINQELERTLSVMEHEIPAGTKFIKNYGSLPRFSCLGGMLAQVLFNLLRNALQSRKEGLVIRLATQWTGQEFLVSIADNGPGIPAENRLRVFEPFFTTREVGAGAGLGLAVVYDVVHNWGGRISLTESPGGGANFTLHIPEKSTQHG
jgi:signal transduction histidine kinase